MRITRKQIYATLAGVGILVGAAGIANAATGTSTPPPDTTAQPPAASANPDDADGGIEANEANEANEADEGPDQNDSAAGEQNDAADGEQDGTSYTSSVTVADDSVSASEADEQAQLAGLATINADDASRAALAAQPGTVTDVQLENENGNVVYSVIVDTGNGSVDIKVDAGNANVLSTEADEGDGHDDAGNQQAEADEAPGTEADDD
jgi:uncharacterized membrane protein YkoI